MKYYVYEYYIHDYLLYIGKAKGNPYKRFAEHMYTQTQRLSLESLQSITDIVLYEFNNPVDMEIAEAYLIAIKSPAANTKNITCKNIKTRIRNLPVEVNYSFQDFVTTFGKNQDRFEHKSVPYMPYIKPDYLTINSKKSRGLVSIIYHHDEVLYVIYDETWKTDWEMIFDTIREKYSSQCPIVTRGENHYFSSKAESKMAYLNIISKEKPLLMPSHRAYKPNTSLDIKFKERITVISDDEVQAINNNLSSSMQWHNTRFNDEKPYRLGIYNEPIYEGDSGYDIHKKCLWKMKKMTPRFYTVHYSDGSIFRCKRDSLKTYTLAKAFNTYSNLNSYSPLDIADQPIIEGHRAISLNTPNVISTIVKTTAEYTTLVDPDGKRHYHKHCNIFVCEQNIIHAINIPSRPYITKDRN